HHSRSGDATEAKPAPPCAGALSPTNCSASYVLATHQSHPLIEDVQVTNKVSQNLHAELALRLIGKLKSDDGSLTGGLNALSAFVAQAGIGADEFYFRDGSGLSRQTLVTPEATVKLLRHIYQQKWAKAYIDTLPTANVDGSLRDRLKNGNLKGHVHAK